MTTILHRHLPHAPWMAEKTARLPGIQPMNPDEWFLMDEVFTAQMALRDHLLAERRDRVYACLPGAMAAAEELRDRVIAFVAGRPGYAARADGVRRPDGVFVGFDDAPLVVAARLVQDDLCLLQADGAEHQLTAAVLCFPASWTLAQKMGRPLTGIHTPVADYAGDLARRVQRLFDAIRPEQPLWRQNWFLYEDPSLHQPRLEFEERPVRVKPYVRSERQSLMRLPHSGAVVFGIHTYVLDLASLTAEQRAGLLAARPQP